MVAELRLESFEQAEGIGGGAGEAGEHLAFVELAEFLGVVLHDDVAERDLAVAADGGPRGSANGQNGSGTQTRHGCGILRWCSDNQPDGEQRFARTRT